MATPSVSVVIPVYRDAAALARLLARLDAAEPAPDQVVVVSADPASISGAAGSAARIVEASANRGAQLDAGAGTATGDILWFLHADAEPPGDAVGTIRAAVAAGAESGCFRFEFGAPRRWWMPWIERLIGWRITAGGMVYGDQGLFATAAAYRAAGGFAHAPLFEEVRLVRALRARGTFARLQQRLRVSPRRWERDGWWRRTLHNRWLAACYMVGVPATKLARRYRSTLDANGGPER